jgi:hypothetical protein
MAAAEAANAAAWRAQRQQLLGLTAFERHKRLMADWVQFYGGSVPEQAPLLATRTDHDVLREQYRRGVAASFCMPEMDPCSHYPLLRMLCRAGSMQASLLACAVA